MSLGRGSILVMAPILDDWEAAAAVLERLDGVLAARSESARVVLIDDGSRLPAEPALARLRPRAITSIEILRLRRNLGHQRAIAVGLSWAEAMDTPPDFTVVMDGDGQDDPADVPRLLSLARERPDTVVFASRARRPEGWVFRLGYHFYRLLHRVLTGRSVRVGNFSVVPALCLRRLVGVSEIWNHYAAAVFRSKIPCATLPAARARRIAGESKMDLVSLTIHGISALSVHADLITVRLLIAAALTLAGLLSTILAFTAVRLLSDLAIPAWAVALGGVLFVLLVQLAILAALFALMALQRRAAVSFIPFRDHALFLGAPQTTAIFAPGPEKTATTPERFA